MSTTSVLGSFSFQLNHDTQLKLKHSIINSVRWLSSARFKYKPGYRPCDLLSIECSHWLKLQHSDWRADLVKDFFEKTNFPPMRALKFFTGHMIYNLAYT